MENWFAWMEPKIGGDFILCSFSCTVASSGSEEVFRCPVAYFTERASHQHEFQEETVQVSFNNW
jgi:hypothetical protein